MTEENKPMTFLEALTQIAAGGKWALMQNYKVKVVKIGKERVFNKKDGSSGKSQDVDLSDGTATLRYTDWNPPTNLVEGQGAELEGAFIKGEKSTDGTKWWFSINVKSPGKIGLIRPLKVAPCEAKATPAELYQIGEGKAAVAQVPKDGVIVLPITRKSYPYAGAAVKKGIDALFGAIWALLSKEQKEGILAKYKTEIDMLDWDAEEMP